ncbi:MAG: MarR family transcriptional regulator [Novosphingobium sp.]
MAQVENKILANRLKSLAAELIGISKTVDSEGLAQPAKAFMFEAPDRGASPGEGIVEDSDVALAAHAEGLYQERRRRSRHFPPHLFAEPAWDILLDLFVNGVRNRAISITSACIAGGIPATTGLRWLGLLEKEGLLEREISGDDARVTLVRLSDRGMAAVRKYLAEAPGLAATDRAREAADFD